MTQPAQAAAAPLKVYVAATSDFPASAMEKRLLEAQEFQTGSVVVVSKVADADAVIQVGGDTTWPYYEYQFRLWSLPSEALVASGKVSEPDETKAFTHLVQEVVKAIRTVQDSPKPASKPKGPPTTGELQGYVLKARQGLAEMQNVPERQVRAVGDPLLAPRPDRARWSPPPLDWEDLPHSGRASKALVKLDAGLGNEICGYHRALIMWDDRVEILNSMDSYDIKDAIPISEEECRRVSRQLERFYDVAMHVELGPKRFLPFLANKVITDLEHTEGELRAPNKEKRQSLALHLDFMILLTLTSFEGLPEPEFFKDPTPEEDEMHMTARVFKPFVNTLRNALSRSGAPNRVRLAEVRPYLREVAAWGLSTSVLSRTIKVR